MILGPSLNRSTGCSMQSHFSRNYSSHKLYRSTLVRAPLLYRRPRSMPNVLYIGVYMLFYVLYFITLYASKVTYNRRSLQYQKHAEGRGESIRKSERIQESTKYPGGIQRAYRRSTSDRKRHYLPHPCLYP